jgi:hypothetical protein
MSHDIERLETRIRRLESQNRRLKWIGILVAVLAMASTVWAQKAGTPAMQAQKFELRDDAGKLRADLAILNGEPVLSFYDKNGGSESFIDGDQFTIFKKGGGEADIQAAFGAHGLSFEDGHDRVFVSLRGDEENQTGKLQLNDYRHKTFSGVTPADLSKLQPERAR